MLLVSIVSLLLAGCDGSKADAPEDTAADHETGDADTDSDTDTDTDTDTDSDTDTDGDTDTDSDTDGDIPDVREQMDASAEGCQDLGGATLSGGAEYFWGEYREDGRGAWTGQEAVYFFANDTWKAAGGSDCVGYWVATGVPGDVGSCPSCEVGMAVTATYDHTTSTCPAGMYDIDFEENYAIHLVDDGTATWYFAGSGRTMGVGYQADGIGMNFLSARSCTWF